MISRNTLIGMMIFAIATLFGPVPAQAMETRAFDNAQSSRCSVYTPEIEISYTEGEKSLTARVIVHSTNKRAARSTAQVSWQLPTGERGRASTKSSKGQAILPMKGDGTYTVSAVVTTAGCTQEVTEDMVLLTKCPPDDDGCGGDPGVPGNNPGSTPNPNGGCGQGSTQTGSIGSDTLHGTADNDYIRGKAGKDHLYGYACDDDIRGGWGKDYIYGGSGRDTIYGNGGKDTIYGGAGNDWIHGGNGKDVCYGGPGIDTFIKCETAIQ